VSKIGARAFRQFIEGNKKDFILFQLEVALKDAGNDSSKKAAVVNQVAETISKINKAEDFTRQQDYIRKSADLLKIEETGLNVLVNKFIRERVSKQDFKLPAEEAPADEPAESGDRSDWSNESFSLLHQDILQEQAIVRVLIEHGLKKWDEEKSVAEYIFDENIDDDLFEDEKLLKTLQLYKRLYLSGVSPTVKQLVHDEDEEVAQTTITITNFPYDYSKKWLDDLNAGGVNEKIWTMPYQKFMNHVIINGDINREIYNLERDDDYKHVVEDAMVFLKLRKLKKLILMNQKDMQLQHPDNEMMTLIQTHSHLKQIQMDLGKNKGMALYPF
jgi:DNA primase